MLHARSVGMFKCYAFYILRCAFHASGVLPWAAATHCAFGLWMHTRFYAGEIQSLSDLTNRASGGIASLAETDIGHRITQLNGLPLLILLICHVTMHGLIRYNCSKSGHVYVNDCKHCQLCSLACLTLLFVQVCTVLKARTLAASSACAVIC